MRIKKIVIPLITLVILVSQISGCAIMNRDDAAGILADNDEVVVEYAEPDENAGADGAAGQIDTSVPEDTSEDLEDAEIGVVDNIGTLDEETGPEQAEQAAKLERRRPQRLRPQRFQRLRPLLRQSQLIPSPQSMKQFMPPQQSTSERVSVQTRIRSVHWAEAKA